MKDVVAVLLFLASCGPMATLERTANDSVYRPGVPLQVTIRIVPDPGTLAYALEERPPTGWSIQNISDGGNYVSPLIKIGPFFDGNPRTIAYRATPPQGTAADGTFSGVVSFDGVSSSIGGVVVIKLDQEPPASPI